MERWYNHRKSRRHACLKRALLSTVSFIIKFCLTPPPQSMLFVVEERLEGLKYNISLRGGTQGEGIDNYVHYAKKGCFTKVSQHFCPSLQGIVVFTQNLNCCNFHSGYL